MLDIRVHPEPASLILDLCTVPTQQQVGPFYLSTCSGREQFLAGLTKPRWAQLPAVACAEYLY